MVTLNRAVAKITTTTITTITTITIITIITIITTITTITQFRNNWKIQTSPSQDSSESRVLYLDLFQNLKTLGCQSNKCNNRYSLPGISILLRTTNFIFRKAIPS